MRQKIDRIFYPALSLLLAILFWLYVDNEQGNLVTKTYTDIPVNFIGEVDVLPSRGLMLTEGADTTIDLRLSGNRRLMASLEAEDLRIQVDLTTIPAVGTYTLSYRILLPDAVDNSSVTQDWASQSTVTVQVAELFTKAVPVQIDIVGDVAADHILMKEKLVAQPTTISVNGQEQDVEAVSSARVRLDLTNASSTVSGEFEFDLLDNNGEVVDSRNLRLSEKKVSVVAPVYITKTLPLVVKFIESPGSMEKNVEWSLEHETIQVAGEESSLSAKESIQLAEIDLSQMSDIEMDLPISLPVSCINLSGFTSSRLTLKFVGVESRSFSVSNVIPINIPDGLDFIPITASIDVLVRSELEQLEQMTAEDIRVVVDVGSHTTAGTYYNEGMVLVDGFDAAGAVGNYMVAYRMDTQENR